MCLRSILEQTHRNLEVIVYDDASTDGSVDKVKELDDPRIVLIEAKENHGPGFGRNRAMEAATGEWIAMQDADDMSNIYRISLQLKAMDITKRITCRTNRRITRILHRMTYRALPPGLGLSCGNQKGTFPSTILPARPIVWFAEDVPWHHERLWVWDVAQLYGLAATVHPGLYYRNMAEQPHRICNDMLDRDDPLKKQIRTLSNLLYRERQWHYHERVQKLKEERSASGVAQPDRTGVVGNCKHHIRHQPCGSCTCVFQEWALDKWISEWMEG